MKSTSYIPSVVDLAYQIIDMDSELRSLRKEVADLTKYKEDYFKLLNETVKHNESMTAGLLEIVMTPGVLEATAKAAKAKEITS